MKDGNEDNRLQYKIAKLRWACRRGMLELDVLLGNFLEQVYPTLTLPDQQLFEHLLSCSDPELFSFLMGKNSPVENGLARITMMIKQHARCSIPD
ncbi:MAG: hypothetical protein A3F12_04095 [Gammaproteobacteria bacterium RIFCSPHIGHO2_12_FULL_38_14]|nr:MAG: hypothetical protein A3F12_04095 [Gammaproteobacteria bacterium RIFCSPHIGHO2_12_FULL_38_14]